MSGHAGTKSVNKSKPSERSVSRSSDTAIFDASGAIEYMYEALEAANAQVEEKKSKSRSDDRNKSLPNVVQGVVVGTAGPSSSATGGSAARVVPERTSPPRRRSRSRERDNKTDDEKKGKAKHIEIVVEPEHYHMDDTLGSANAGQPNVGLPVVDQVNLAASVSLPVSFKGLLLSRRSPRPLCTRLRSVPIRPCLRPGPRHKTRCRRPTPRHRMSWTLKGAHSLLPPKSRRSGCATRPLLLKSGAALNSRNLNSVRSEVSRLSAERDNALRHLSASQGDSALLHEFYKRVISALNEARDRERDMDSKTSQFELVLAEARASVRDNTEKVQRSEQEAARLADMASQAREALLRNEAKYRADVAALRSEMQSEREEAARYMREREITQSELEQERTTRAPVASGDVARPPAPRQASQTVDQSEDMETDAERFGTPGVLGSAGTREEASHFQLAGAIQDIARQEEASNAASRQMADLVVAFSSRVTELQKERSEFESRLAQQITSSVGAAVAIAMPPPPPPPPPPGLVPIVAPASGGGDGSKVRPKAKSCSSNTTALSRNGSNERTNDGAARALAGKTATAARSATGSKTLTLTLVGPTAGQGGIGGASGGNNPSGSDQRDGSDPNRQPSRKSTAPGGDGDPPDDHGDDGEGEGDDEGQGDEDEVPEEEEEEENGDGEGREGEGAMPDVVLPVDAGGKRQKPKKKKKKKKPDGGGDSDPSDEDSSDDSSKKGKSSSLKSFMQTIRDGSAHNKEALKIDFNLYPTASNIRPWRPRARQAILSASGRPLEAAKYFDSVDDLSEDEIKAAGEGKFASLGSKIVKWLMDMARSQGKGPLYDRLLREEEKSQLDRSVLSGRFMLKQVFIEFALSQEDVEN